jgi:hypothetical protein
MKKVTLLFGLLLAVSASIASAAPGVGLRWNGCLSDGGAANKSFACNANNGTNVLAGTFELGADLLSTSGEEIVIDLASASSPLPAWWQFKNPGTCRTGSLGISAAALLTSANCADWGGGLAGAGLGAYIVGGAGPNTARIVAASAVPPSGLQDLTTGTEYFAFQITINNLKTVGTGNCAGCLDPVCIVFNSLNMTTPVLANNVKLSGPSNGTDANFVTWQGGAGVTTGRGIGCPAATPTKSKTWSQVKSMYR